MENIAITLQRVDAFGQKFNIPAQLTIEQGKLLIKCTAAKESSAYSHWSIMVADIAREFDSQSIRYNLLPDGRLQQPDCIKILC